MRLCSKTIVPLLALFILLQACATGYKKDGLTGGFSETRLDENIFMVSFRGNGYTKTERAIDFTLLRCAELTLQHGFKYFIVTEANTSVKVSTYKTPKTSYTSGTAYGSNGTTYGYATTTKHGGDTYEVHKPSTSNTIVCYKERPDGVVSYNAEFVYQSISEKYNIRH